MDADKQRGTAPERGTERPDAAEREERNRRRLWEEMPTLTEPEEGRPISPCGYLAYKARKSSENQARTWNVILAGHPRYDPTICGFVVGVADPCAPADQRRWPLVWRRLPILASARAPRGCANVTP